MLLQVFHESTYIVPSSGSAETLKNVRKRSKTLENHRKRSKTSKTFENVGKRSKRRKFFPAATEPQTSAAAAAAAAAAVAAAAAAPRSWPPPQFRHYIFRYYIWDPLIVCRFGWAKEPWTGEVNEAAEDAAEGKAGAQ